MSYPPTLGPVDAAKLICAKGDEGVEVTVPVSGLSIGRRADKNLVVEDPRVSRDHAEIVYDQDGWLLRDLHSRHGTWVNGVQTATARLKPGDEIALGSASGPKLVFSPLAGIGQEFLSMFGAVPATSAGDAAEGAAGDLERLSLFLDLARKLESPGALEDLLVCLIETTLRLTGAERGFIFLRESEALRLAAARGQGGEVITDDGSISHSTITDALGSLEDFIFADASAAAEQRQSILRQDLRMVLCIPLRSRRVREEMAQSMMASPSEALGVLYLDSHRAAGEFSALSSGLLRTVAGQAAHLVENARLAAAEREARHLRQELAVAAEIQRRLLPAEWPRLEGVELAGRSLPCHGIGGDFFDTLVVDGQLYAALLDISGKGISAALLASTLQGLLYAQLVSGASLAQAAAAANRYLCERIGGEKYATGLLVRIGRDGSLEYLNCGHVPPLLVRFGTSAVRIERLDEGGVPIGLIPGAEYASSTTTFSPGDRLLLVTDGVTELENEAGEFFGDERLEMSFPAHASLDSFWSVLDAFRGTRPMRDDCTLLEIRLAAPSQA